MAPSADFLLLARMTSGVRVSLTAQLHGANLDRLVELASAHRVAGALIRTLRALGQNLPATLLAIDDMVTANHLLVVGALDRAGRALDAAGLRWVVVKGPVIAQRWPCGWRDRWYGDLDLLVDPRSLGAAVTALRAAGFEHRNRNWDGFRELGVGEVPLDDGAAVIDLHWSLVGLGRDRRCFDLPTADLLDRSVRVDVGRVQARTLDPVDTFVHLGVHHALAGGRELAQLVDVRSASVDLDPDVAWDRLQAAGAARLVGGLVGRAERVFGLVTPARLAERLHRDRSWLALNRVVDGAFALPRSRSVTPYPGAIVKAGRSTRRATAEAVLDDLLTALRARTGRRTLVSDGGSLDWRVDAGGQAGYERFVEEVAAGRYGR
jgi:hypothetical protein